MDYNDARHFIEFVVDSMGPLRPKESNAVLVTLDLKASFHGDCGLEIASWSSVQTLVSLDTNYKSVWSKVSNKPYFTPNIGGWVFRARHDSCWRSDGLKFLFDLWIAERDDLLSKIMESGSDEDRKAARNISFINSKVNFKIDGFYPASFMAIETVKTGDYKWDVSSIDAIG